MGYLTRHSHHSVYIGRCVIEVTSHLRSSSPYFLNESIDVRIEGVVFALVIVSVVVVAAVVTKDLEIGTK